MCARHIVLSHGILRLCVRVAGEYSSASISSRRGWFGFRRNLLIILAWKTSTRSAKGRILSSACMLEVGAHLLTPRTSLRSIVLFSLELSHLCHS